MLVVIIPPTKNIAKIIEVQPANTLLVKNFCINNHTEIAKVEKVVKTPK